jgi:hypothetical protein
MAEGTGNLQAAWVAMLLGCVAGAVQGLFFRNVAWLGGYDSWKRRMTRLGHISFFGIGFINLLFALSLPSLGSHPGLIWGSRLLVIGAILMPLVCYLSAIDDRFRHLFFLPAGSVIAATGIVVWRLFAT